MPSYVKSLFMLSALSATIISCHDNYQTEFVSVDGKIMAYESFGLTARKPGDPVLIFESGLGASSRNFQLLFPTLAKNIQGIAYDRNGLGESEADATVKTDGDVVRRLHDLLKQTKIDPPYILVGHSYGGPLIRLFTSLYPNEVTGLVFIDPSDFMLTKEEDEQAKAVSQSPVGFRDWNILLQKPANDTTLPVSVRNDFKRVMQLNSTGSFNEYTSLLPLHEMPVSILIAYNTPIDNYSMDQLKELKINPKLWSGERNKYRIAHFAAMIENNHNSSMVLLPGYVHFIHQQDPELVISAIKNVYNNTIDAAKKIHKYIHK
jgi:pimeloyl-ACP methyl ester carboxylesterase